MVGILRGIARYEKFVIFFMANTGDRLLRTENPFPFSASNRAPMSISLSRAFSFSSSKLEKRKSRTCNE
ncbi:unnamed protein product [Linum trigynum]|uniref:Uncharacterized protein n=1 Tax=Linum trigynum TaxID=586398 RepID=A0AAV2CZJ3_9ROSI